MKILKQLSKFFTIIFISSTFIKSAISNEPVDIWNIEKKENVIEETLLKNNESINNENIQEINILDKNKNIIINDPSNLNDIKLAGLYDPADNGLSIDMWSNSNGEEIKYFLDKLSSKKLSNFSEKILDVALLTNSYLPSNNISHVIGNDVETDLETQLDLQMESLIANQAEVWFWDDNGWLLSFASNFFIALPK